MLNPLVQFNIGIALLLLGVQLLRHGLVNWGHSQLQRILRRATSTPLRGFFWGTLATALVQSSTAVTVLAVGLVDGGAITFYQSLGIVLGANVGTCVTVQLLALDLEALALPALSAGAVLTLARRSRAVGIASLGCGLIFGSLGLMGAVLSSYEGSHSLRGYLSAMAATPLQGLVAGTLLTAFLHSSSVVTGVAMVLVSQGVISLLPALALVLGANIGTCITAILASLLSSWAAKRTAMAHLFINVSGAFLILPFLSLAATLLPLLTPDPGRQVAHFHTLFNLFSSLAALVVIKPLALFLTWLVPDGGPSGKSGTWP
ncbi:MAG: Na/Pi cotransporter family protein [Thermoanaerobacteraceae bacterium]|nr:Na/Pi cotransporter family protein [Thermoanaerobacteraceae bacterium]